MFSFLDMLNHSLGYFNINTKLKNKIYTTAEYAARECCGQHIQKSESRYTEISYRLN